MSDREKVITGLECCSVKQSCLECPWQGKDCNDRLHLAALELLKSQPEQKFFVDSDGKITPLPIQPQWISVEDKLPDKSNRYLVYFGKGIGTTMKTAYWLRTKQKWMGSEAHSTITDITHWMPLPEPPEEVKQE